MNTAERVAGLDPVEARAALAVLASTLACLLVVYPDLEPLVLGTLTPRDDEPPQHQSCTRTALALVLEYLAEIDPRHRN